MTAHTMHLYRRYAELQDTAYENHDLTLDTSAVWCVHICTVYETNTQEAISRLCKDDEHASTRPLWELDILTGEYLTTSWTTWGEDPAEDDWSLVVYFRSPLETAYTIGRTIALRALNKHDDYIFIDGYFAVSTAGDWAEQIKASGAER